MPLLLLFTVLLYNANKLIQLDTNINRIAGEDDYRKASKLVIALEKWLQTHFDPDQCLYNICHVLRNQHQRLTDIATSILKQLGQSYLHEHIAKTIWLF